ncbi:MAG: hypothetical protein ACRCVT_02155 [Leadbetterella sp.]
MEYKILEMIGMECTEEEIAYELDMPILEVKTNIKILFGKLEVNSIIGLFKAAVKHKIIDLK